MLLSFRGIADDRSCNNDSSFFAANSSKLVANTRKLRSGDVITVTVDLSIPQVEISVNEGEFSHVFNLESVGKNKPEQFWFGATFGELFAPTFN